LFLRLPAADRILEWHPEGLFADHSDENKLGEEYFVFYTVFSSWQALKSCNAVPYLCTFTMQITVNLKDLFGVYC
jgi:hypothetical protein